MEVDVNGRIGGMGHHDPPSSPRRKHDQVTIWHGCGWMDGGSDETVEHLDEWHRYGGTT